MKELPGEYVGTQLSYATMRPEDLIPTFMDFLHDVKDDCQIATEVDDAQAEVDELETYNAKGYGEYYQSQEDADWVLNEDIWDILNDIAPRFTYFGAHEGDGSAYGFWTDREAFMEHIQDVISIVNDNLDGGDVDFDQIKLVIRNVNKLFEYHNE
jgi:hypothetical protein